MPLPCLRYLRQGDISAGISASQIRLIKQDFGLVSFFMVFQAPVPVNFSKGRCGLCAFHSQLRRCVLYVNLNKCCIPLKEA